MLGFNTSVRQMQRAITPPAGSECLLQCGANGTSAVICKRMATHHDLKTAHASVQHTPHVLLLDRLFLALSRSRVSWVFRS